MWIKRYVGAILVATGLTMAATQAVLADDAECGFGYVSQVVVNDPTKGDSKNLEVNLDMTGFPNPNMPSKDKYVERDNLLFTYIEYDNDSRYREYLATKDSLMSAMMARLPVKIYDKNSKGSCQDSAKYMRVTICTSEAQCSW